MGQDFRILQPVSVDTQYSPQNTPEATLCCCYTSSVVVPMGHQ